MIVSTMLVVLAGLAADHQFAAAQYPMTFGPGGNVTGLKGTWSSGAGNVLTGEGFANPTNRSFTYPATAGISYSFDDDGWYELARYRFISNGTEPTCIKGVIGWSHGTWNTSDDGSKIYITPLEDSFQQVQDPCAAVSNFIENFNDTEEYAYWQVYTDTAKGTTARLYQFDGQPLPPMFQISTTPNMLPKQKLANASGLVSDDSAEGSSRTLLKRTSGAARQSSATWKSTGIVAVTLAGVSLFFL